MKKYEYQKRISFYSTSEKTKRDIYPTTKQNLYKNNKTNNNTVDTIIKMFGGEIVNSTNTSKFEPQYYIYDIL